MIISIAIINFLTTGLNFSTSNEPSEPRNFIRFIDARLHAVSSKKRYSLQGLVAFILPEFLHVWYFWITESHWIPGSPQIHVPSATFFIASINSSGTLTLILQF